MLCTGFLWVALNRGYPVVAMLRLPIVVGLGFL